MNPLILRLLMACLCAWVNSARAQAAVECRWSSHPITIDGKADEASWQKADWINGFHELSTGGKPKSGVKAALLWDSDALYFFAEMEDADLFADITEHDGQTWDNDVFELFFQPKPAERRYYEFQVNAANTQFDMLIDRRGSEPFDIKQWISAQKFNMQSAVVLRGTLNQREDTDTGWSVEGRIPWSDFAPTQGRPANGAEWRFLNSRYDFKKGERPELSASVVLPPRGGFHQPDAWGALKFVGQPARAQGSWRNERLRGTPEPPPPFRTKRVYSQIKSQSAKTLEREAYGPVMARRQPGGNYIWFLENYGYSELRGVLRRFETASDAKDSEALLEVKEYAYSFTFHPGFSTNGFVFLGLNGPGAEGTNHTRIVRVTFDHAAGRIEPGSRKLIIEWPSAGHNGGDTAFGNDGMLYLTSGDGTSGMDVDKVGQDLNSLLSKVLRIDVDSASPAEGYRVPSDNPFVGQAGIRPETWAYGLRNPWRISHDPVSGQIWVGENGQDLREYAHLVQRGANYGWSAYEGSRKMFPDRLRGPSPHTPPVVEHDHSAFRSLTGGLVYRGREFPELTGAYLYGDYSTGRIWAVLHDGSKTIWRKELADTSLAIVAFGEDADGEPLIVDYGGGFHRMERREPEASSAPFPTLLSETGLFTDAAAEEPAPGVLRYQISLPGWHDGATSKHWMALPESARLHPDVKGAWTADDGIALVQTLSLPDGSRAPRRIETRVLLKQENDWAAYTYVWNATQTDAELAPANGARVSLSLSEGKRDWLVPGRSDCLMCHSRAANFALTLKTRQLNVQSQLARFQEGGIMNAGEQTLAALQRHAPFPAHSSRSAPLEERARAYLAVNCAHCHTSDGGGNSAMEMLPDRALAAARLINEPPLHGNLGLKDPRIITPGAPAKSILITRTALRIPGQMPPIGSLRPDIEAIRLLSSWISSMPVTAPPAPAAKPSIP